MANYDNLRRYAEEELQLQLVEHSNRYDPTLPFEERMKELEFA
jgi:hypothetical protein